MRTRCDLEARHQVLERVLARVDAEQRDEAVDRRQQHEPLRAERDALRVEAEPRRREGGSGGGRCVRAWRISSTWRSAHLSTRICRGLRVLALANSPRARACVSRESARAKRARQGTTFAPCSAMRALLVVVVLSAGCAGRNEARDVAPDDAGPSANRHDAGVARQAVRPTGLPSHAELRPDVGLGLDCTTNAGHPTLLGCTGLYVNWTKKTISSDVHTYNPFLHLWSDGAEKQRFVRLPPGTTIDTRDMDSWTFPIGTQFWKDFSLDGKHLETRYLEKRADGSWFRTTYAWSANQTSADELTTGAKNVFGTGLDIPAEDDCVLCHQGRRDGVLGFEAIGLSMPEATGLTISALTDMGLITDPPAEPIRIPGNATEAAALGWLHANCGNACHNSTSTALAESRPGSACA